MKSVETVFTHPHSLYVLEKEDNKNDQGEGTGRRKAEEESAALQALSQDVPWDVEDLSVLSVYIPNYLLFLLQDNYKDRTPF